MKLELVILLTRWFDLRPIDKHTTLLATFASGTKQAPH